MNEATKQALRASELFPFLVAESEVDGKQILKFAIYENEVKRLSGIKTVYGSGAGFLVPAFDRTRFTNDDGYKTIKSLDQTKPLLGFAWLEDDWSVEINEQTDNEGYQYAFSWATLNHNSPLALEDSKYTNVRRKKWVRRQIEKSGELASTGQRSQSSTFVPYELLLTIRRADLQGFTSATFVEVYVDGKLADKTQSGKSEWDKPMVLPFYELPNLSTKIICVVKSDALLEKLHESMRIKGEVQIPIRDILDTKCLSSSKSAELYSVERDYFLTPADGKKRLTVNFKLLEHRLFRLEVDSDGYMASNFNSDISTKSEIKHQRFIDLLKSFVSEVPSDLLSRYPKALKRVADLIVSLRDENFSCDLLCDVLALAKDAENRFYKQESRIVRKNLYVGAHIASSLRIYRCARLLNGDADLSPPENYNTMLSSLVYPNYESLATVDCDEPLAKSGTRVLLRLHSDDGLAVDCGAVVFEFRKENDAFEFLKSMASAGNERENLSVEIFSCNDVLVSGDTSNNTRGKAGCVCLYSKEENFFIRCTGDISNKPFTFCLNQVAAVDVSNTIGAPCSHLLDVSVCSLLGLGDSQGPYTISMFEAWTDYPSNTVVVRKPADDICDAVAIQTPIDLKCIQFALDSKRSVSPVIVQVSSNNNLENAYRGIAIVSPSQIVQASNKRECLKSAEKLYSSNEISSFHINFKSASSLIGVDVTFTSDPYLLVYLIDAQGKPVVVPQKEQSQQQNLMFGFRRRSTVGFINRSEYCLPNESILFISDVKSKTCNPVWNSSINLPSSVLIQGRCVIVEVWDNNSLAQHVCLGMVTIPIDFARAVSPSRQSTQVERNFYLKPSCKTPAKYHGCKLGVLTLESRYQNPDEINNASLSNQQVTLNVVCRQLYAFEAHWPCWLQGEGVVGKPSPLRFDISDYSYLALTCPTSSDGNAYMNSSILKECSELETKDGLNVVRVPWDAVNLQSVTVLAPLNALSLDVALHRKFPSGEVRELKISIFVGPCPAIAVQLLVVDRVNALYLRMRINPDSQLPLAPKKAHIIRDNLNPFTSACKSIDDDITALTKAPYPENSSTQMQLELLRRLKIRLQLYCSCVIDASCFDYAGSGKHVKSSEVDTCLAQFSEDNFSVSLGMNSLADALRADVWNLALERRSETLSSLSDELSYFIHGAYLRVVGTIRKLVEGQGIGIAEVRRQLLHAVIANDSLFSEALQPVLAAFELKLSNTPLLTHSLKFDDLQREMYSLLSAEIKSFLANSLANTRMTRYNEGDSTSAKAVRMPWEISADNGSTSVFSNIPVDTQFNLNLQIECRVVFPHKDWSSKNVETIQECNFKVARAVAESYESLASDYSDAIAQICSDADKYLMTHAEEREAIEDCVAEFLCSVANDTDRIINTNIPSCKKSLSARSKARRQGFQGENSCDDEGFPLISCDADLVFERATACMEDLGRKAVSVIVTRFYESYFDKLFIRQLEEPFLRQLPFRKTLSLLVRDDDSLSLGNLLQTIIEFTHPSKGFVKKYLLEKFYVLLVQDLFERLMLRYLLIARDAKVDNESSSPTTEDKPRRQSFFDTFHNSHARTQDTESEAFDLPDEVTDLLIQDSNSIADSFKSVMDFSSVDAEEQIRLSVKFRVQAFLLIIQRACLTSAVEKSLDRQNLENEVQLCFGRALPAHTYYLETSDAKFEKIRAFLLDRDWKPSAELLTVNARPKTVALSYRLEVSSMECFNLHRPINSFVKASLAGQVRASKVQMFTTKPAFSEKWVFEVNVVEKENLVIELVNFRPILRIIKEFVKGRVTIPLKGLVLGEAYKAWYKLSAPDAMLSKEEIAQLGKGETNPSREIQNIQIQLLLKLSLASGKSGSG